MTAGVHARTASAPTRRARAAVIAGLVCASAIFAASALAPAGPAHAHACDRTDNDRAEASRAIRVLTGEIDAMERAIIEALRLQTGQLAGYTAQSTKALTQALDAQTRLQAQTARRGRGDPYHERAPAEPERVFHRHRRDGSARGAECCGDHGQGCGRRWRPGASRATVRWWRKAGSAADGAARFDTLTGVYCSAGRAGDGTCRGEDAWHGADLRPGILLDRRTFGSEAELHAAVELSRNLAAPVVHDPLPLASAETDRERRLVLLARAADARTALAADWFGHARSLRAPGADLGAWADAVSGGRGRDTEASPSAATS